MIQGEGDFYAFPNSLAIKWKLPVLRALSVQDGLHTEKEHKIWSKMSYYMIFYVKDTRAMNCACSGGILLLLIALYLLTDASWRSQKNVISLSFVNSF